MSRTAGEGKLLELWNDAFLAAGINVMSVDRAAKILAMVYVLGGSHSSYTHSVLLRADLEYITKRYGIYGNGTPDSEITPLIRKYAEELNSAYMTATEKNEVGLRVNWYPEWATKIAKHYNLPQNNSI